MIDPSHEKLSIVRQCDMLNICRSSFYYKCKPIKPEDLALMRLIDEQFLKTPTWGSRKMADWLWRHHGMKKNRKRIQRLMRLMGLKAIYPRPRTTQPHPGHKVYPYLLRGVAIERPNQVWSADITYIPMRRGYMYLVAIIDWYSRKTLSWRVSNTMEADFCVEALEEALARYGKPQIFNTDQGAQFTSTIFTERLKDHQVAISMDGRGRCQDNIFIERLWWTLKYDYIYLHAFDNGNELRRGLDKWFSFYNQERPHQKLDGRTPDDVYYGLPATMAEAA